MSEPNHNAPHAQAHACCHASAHEKREEKADLVLDPVCGMRVDPAATAHHVDEAGQTYHFCSDGCRIKFAAGPECYLGKQGEPEPLPQGTLYTCPMHPEIVKEGPGHCPICGMADRKSVV